MYDTYTLFSSSLNGYRVKNRRLSLVIYSGGQFCPFWLTFNVFLRPRSASRVRGVLRRGEKANNRSVCALPPRRGVVGVSSFLYSRYGFFLHPLMFYLGKVASSYRKCIHPTIIYILQLPLH